MAQIAKVTGKVSDPTGEPLVGVSVYISSNSNLGTTTEAT